MSPLRTLVTPVSQKAVFTQSPVTANAITNAVSTKYGVNAAFHVIQNIVISDINSTISLVVNSYVDQQSYLASKTPLMISNINILGANYSTVANAQNLITGIYSYLATLPAFQGQ